MESKSELFYDQLDMRYLKFSACAWFFMFWAPILAASEPGPKVLAVVAHPDDETCFAATVYKITHELNGMVDVVMITNGEGGYKYSTFAEPIYHLNLTNEKIGREHLPFIRKKEALNGGQIMGVRNYYFLEQIDTGYTLDPNNVLKGAWDVPRIKKMIQQLIHDKEYEFLFVLLPTKETHGHHKAATLLALEVVRNMKQFSPIILGATLASKDKKPLSFSGLEGYSITRAHPDPVALMDKTQKFGYHNKLDYQIVVNWVIAEHKSQGTMQLLMNKGDYEAFYSFDLNDPDAIAKVKALFNLLAKSKVHL